MWLRHLSVVTTIASVSFLTLTPRTAFAMDGRPCTEQEACAVAGAANEACGNESTPGHNMCAGPIQGCWVNEQETYIDFSYACYDYGEDPCTQWICS
jgi:hypothetical protein